MLHTFFAHYLMSSWTDGMSELRRILVLTFFSFILVFLRTRFLDGFHRPHTSQEVGGGVWVDPRHHLSFCSHLRIKSRLFLCLSLIRLYILAKHFYAPVGISRMWICTLFSPWHCLFTLATFLKCVYTRRCIVWWNFWQKIMRVKYIAAYSLQGYLNVIPLGSDSSLYFCCEYYLYFVLIMERGERVLISTKYRYSL